MRMRKALTKGKYLSTLCLSLPCFSTGYIGSMGLGMNFFCAPFTSALCDRFGCRRVQFYASCTCQWTWLPPRLHVRGAHK